MHELTDTHDYLVFLQIHTWELRPSFPTAKQEQVHIRSLQNCPLFVLLSLLLMHLSWLIFFLWAFLSFASSLILSVSLSSACNVLYLNSVETESLTGPQAVAKATGVMMTLSPRPSATVVHFKVSTQGITLTDSQRRYTTSYTFVVEMCKHSHTHFL